MNYEQASKIKIGQSVVVIMDDGHKVVLRTRSKVWRLGDGTPVIKIDGIVGCYSLERVGVIE